MLITEQYRQLNAQMHKDLPQFGSKGGEPWKEIRGLCGEHGCKTILDYGCGKRGLVHMPIGIPVFSYDPALDIDERRPCDLVYSRDVLEHVEPDCLGDVLEDIRTNMICRGWFIIATDVSGDILPDGTNAHRIVEPIGWWSAALERHGMVTVAKSRTSPKKSHIEVVPKK